MAVLLAASLTACSGAGAGGQAQGQGGGQAAQEGGSQNGGQAEAGGQDGGQTADRPKELKKFNVGYLATTGHIMYFIAQEKGFFREEGLDVTLSMFSNSGEGINAVIAGKLDAGSFGTAPPFTFIEKGQPITIFGGQMYEGHAIIAKPENAEAFRDLEGFRGKTVATVRLATGDIVLRYGLADSGIDWKKDVKIDELESPAAVLEAVKKGSADAGVVWTPYRKTAEQQGLAIVQYSGDIHGMANHPCCRQIAVTDRLAQDPDAYVAFLSALIRAYDFYKSNHEESIDVLAKYVQVDREILEGETYGEHIGSSPDPNREGVAKFWEAMKAAGYVTSDLDINEHVDTAIYEKALEGILARYPDNANYAGLKADFKA